MIESLASLATLFALGLLGSGHCVAMCGGLAVGLGSAADRGSESGIALGYTLGRILSYSFAGALVAALGYWGHTYLALGPALKVFAGLIVVLMGLYIADWWKFLVHLEKLGAYLWRFIQPLGRYWLPVTSIPRALALGALWGWLPCGLVYTALAYSATAADPLVGAVMMAAFGLGTAPAMLLAGLFPGGVRQKLTNRQGRRIAGAAMIIFGLWSLSTNLQHLDFVAPGRESPVGHHH